MENIEGLKSIGAGDWLRHTVSRKLVNLIDTEIGIVLPDIKSRFDDIGGVNERVINGKSYKTKEVNIGGRNWPNIVAFARATTQDAVHQVMELARKVEDEERLG